MITTNCSIATCCDERTRFVVPLSLLCTTLIALGVLAVAPLATQAPAAEIELLQRVQISGSAHDRSGLSGESRAGSPQDRLGGFSAIEYTGRDNRYLVLSDRGPADGAADYRCRWHELVLDFNTKRPATTATPNEPSPLERTVLLTNADGRPLVGSLGAFDLRRPELNLRFDPEALRATSAGKVLVSDEYGPAIVEFSRDGRQLRTFEVPRGFTLSRPSADPLEENRVNSSGRAANRGFESLAITPSGEKVVALLQGPLLQDSKLERERLVGRHLRMVEFDLKRGTTRQLVYSLAHVDNGISELLAINEHEFLALERDSLGAEAARYKRIVHINLSRATDVTAIERLPDELDSAGIRAVERSDFIDFLDPQFRLTGPRFPAKIEGLTFGPTLADGRRLLVVSIDNDFQTEQPSEIWALAVAPKRLPRFGWGF